MKRLVAGVLALSFMAIVLAVPTPAFAWSRHGGGHYGGGHYGGYFAGGLAVGAITGLVVGSILAPRPVYAAPPVVYQAAPVYAAPAPVYYPTPAYAGPAPVYYTTPAPAYVVQGPVCSNFWVDGYWYGPTWVTGHWQQVCR